jgi:flagellin-like hook-associated protein FlgL
LQEEWKKIGAVPQKVSDKLWNRFRAACDKFYDGMKLHFAEADKLNAENLIAKEALIARVQAFELLDDNNETIEALKALQAEWIGIGHVPMKEKERINDTYRKAMDAQFEKVRGRVGEQNKNLFRAKYQDVTRSPKGQDKIREDKNRLQERIKKIQADIAQQENNISFFAKSKNAEVVLKEVKGRIDAAHNEIKKIREQIKMIDAIRAEAEKPKEEAKAEEPKSEE